jgi:choline monooxygenase
MLPPLAYTSADALEAERRSIFDRSWTCVARTADLPMVGDHLIADIPAGTGVTGDHESIIVVHADDGRLAAFSNACAHRCSALLDGPGNSPRITCPYHAWVYRLDGQLIAAPHMARTIDRAGRAFDPADHGLTRLRLQVWEGFVFVTTQVDAPDLAPSLEPLREVIGRYRLAGYVPVHQQVDVWDTNWKCLVENFMDAYHVFKVHRDSFAKDNDSTADTTVFPGTDAVAHHTVIDSPTGRMGVAHANNDVLDGTWRHTVTLAAVFPTTVMQIQPDYLWYLDVSPLGADRVRVRWDVSVAPEMFESLADPDAYVAEILDLLNLVNAEDRPVVEGVLRGLRRNGAIRGPLSYLERNVFDFDRYVSRSLTSDVSP